MKILLATTVALISLVPGVVTLTVNTPSSLTQCQPTKLTWANGAPPYYISVIPGGQTTLPPLMKLGESNALSLTWVVNVTPNQYINFVVKDSNGDEAYTDQILVQASDDSTCMTATASVSQGTVPDRSSTASQSSSSTGENARTTQASTKGTPLTTSGAPPTRGTTRTSSHASATATGSSHINGASSLSAFGLLTLLPLVGVVFL